jgi:hypothetical protein
MTRQPPRADLRRSIGALAAACLVVAACGGSDDGDDDSGDETVTSRWPPMPKGKPVFNAEYAQAYRDDSSQLCADAAALDLRTLVLPLDLDGSFRISCDE